MKTLVCDTEELCFQGSRNSYKQIKEMKPDGISNNGTEIFTHF